LPGLPHPGHHPRMTITGGIVGAGAATTALALLTVPLAAQAATTAHNPIGHLDSAKGVGLKHGMQIKGWADDPDATTTPLRI
jgi:Spy/CpxP family protein refolding chaperone